VSNEKRGEGSSFVDRRPKYVHEHENCNSHATILHSSRLDLTLQEKEERTEGEEREMAKRASANLNSRKMVSSVDT
jgi:hypothetical protein